MIARRMIDRVVHKTRQIAQALPNRFRRLAASWGSPAPWIYDWSSCWDDTLIRNIVPAGERIGARFEESPRELAARLPGGAGMVVVHLDITDNAPFIADPEEFIQILRQRDVGVMNCLVRDIRKSTVQSCCAHHNLPSVAVGPGGDPDELLIVKTDLNTGGTREQLLSEELKERFKLSVRISGLGGPDGYYVARRADLGVEVWNDPDLVVQRFMQNPQGRFFRIYVVNNAVVVSEAYAGSQIKRIGNVSRRLNHWLWRDGENLADMPGSDSKLPAALLRTAGIFVERFHLDFGAIDVVESEAGDFYVIDVNKTPFWDNEHQPGLLKHLRRGFQNGAKII